MGRFTAAIFTMSVNYAACFAEIYRGGIQSVPAGQYEAGSVATVLLRQMGLAESEMTMTVVTHEVAFARDTSAYLSFMDLRGIVEQGLPQDVMNSPAEERTRAFLWRFNSGSFC